MARSPKTTSGTRDPQPIRIEEGWVDRLGEHFTFTFGDANGDSFPLVARLAKAAPDRAILEFLLDPEDPTYAEIREAVLRNVRFYLVEKGEPSPWQYFLYHCGTGANVYSSVHVGYWPAEWPRLAAEGNSSSTRPENLESARRNPTARRLGDARGSVLLAEQGDEFLLLEDASSALSRAASGAAPDAVLRGFRAGEERGLYIRQRMPHLAAMLDQEAEALVRVELPAAEDLLDQRRAEEALPRLRTVHDRLLNLAGGGIALLHVASCEQVMARAENDRNHDREATGWLRESLVHIGWAALDGNATLARPLRVNALLALGQMAQESGQTARALPLLLDALPDAELDVASSEAPDGIDRLGALLINLGDGLQSEGDRDQAVVLYGRALKILREVVRHDETGERVHALLGTYERLGDAAFRNHEFDRAMKWYEAFLDRAVSMPSGNSADAASRQASICGACSRLTDACLKRNDLEGAERYSAHGLDAIASLDPKDSREVARARGDILNRRARLALAKGEGDPAADLAVQAAECYGQLEGRTHRIDDLLQVAHCWHDAARHLRAAGRDAGSAWLRAMDAAKTLRQFDPGYTGLWDDIKDDRLGFGR
jgi:tetratricopeptide (TPR) repeat protein